MSLSRWICLGLALALCPVRPALAQWPSAVAPGTRVQVRLPEAEFQTGAVRGQQLRGRVARLAPDSLYLAVTDSVGPLAISRHLVERLEISRGVPSRGTSALIQGVRLAVGLALVTALVNEFNDNSSLNFGEAAAVGGGFGLVLGGIRGAVRPEERWRRVAVPASF